MSTGFSERSDAMLVESKDKAVHKDTDTENHKEQEKQYKPRGRRKYSSMKKIIQEKSSKKTTKRSNARTTAVRQQCQTTTVPSGLTSLVNSFHMNAVMQCLFNNAIRGETPEVVEESHLDAFTNLFSGYKSISESFVLSLESCALN